MIRLHHCPQSRSMRTLWLLHELGLDFEVETYPFGKALRAPEYLAKHPLGRVPALEIDGRVLIETGAIAEILTERYPDAGLGRPPGDPEREDFLIWLHFAETLSAHGQILTQQHIVLYEDHMRSPTVMKLEAKRLEKCYGAIEGQMADGRPYLLASGISAADIAVGQAVYLARFFARTEGFPAVEAWMDRLTARPAFQASLPGPDEALIYDKPFYEAPDD